MQLVGRAALGLPQQQGPAAVRLNRQRNPLRGVLAHRRPSRRIFPPNVTAKLRAPFRLITRIRTAMPSDSMTVADKPAADFGTILRQQAAAIATQNSRIIWLIRTWPFFIADKTLAWARGLSQAQEANAYLTGLYAPTRVEAFDEQLEVNGSMPSSMNGMYLRIGPNPYHRPIGNYHWFDGDGMTHAVRIKDGSASYANRYIQTSRLLQEKRAGYPLFDKMGDMAGVGFLIQISLQRFKAMMGVLDTTQGDGRANTALVYHANKLLSLAESDMPYALRMLCNGVVETLGRWDFDGKLKHAFTAHPKKDPVTGELYAFGYDLVKQPHMTYTVINAEGKLTRSIPVHLPKPVLMHDCALTQDYFIILDMPLVFEPERIVKQASLPFFFDKSQPSRFGLLPRDAADESAIKWFELPAMTIMHTANAWQEGPDVVKLAACCFDEFELDIGNAHLKTPEHMPYLWLITLNLATGEASRRRVSSVVGDFPQSPPQLLGRKTRYAYIATMPTEATESGEVASVGFCGVAKLDLAADSEKAAVAGSISYPPGHQGGEAFFVAAEPAANGAPPGEDDGYLVTFVSEVESGATHLAVYSAKSMSSQPLATIRIPQRVPAGFHGLHIKECNLETQPP